MKKKLLRIFFAFIMFFSVLPTQHIYNNEETKIEAATSDMGGYTFYLTPNSNWKQSNARFAMYLCNGTSAAKWYSMSDSDGDGTYEATVDSGENHANIIFCRMNGSNSTNNWNNRWNQSGNLTFDGTKNHCTINAGEWDCGNKVTWAEKRVATYSNKTIYF